MPELKAAMSLSRTLGLPLGAVLGMSLLEVQLWSAYLAPDEPVPDTSGLDGMCD